jgi:1-deoxy-D-xylulose-5-phosphate reductoisomerase
MVMTWSGPRTVSVLGSTGSVGTSTLDLLSRNKDRFRVVALAAGRNATLLAEQAIAFDADLVALEDPEHLAILKSALAGRRTEILSGPGAALEAARRDAEWTMASIVGAAGLKPTLEAVRRGRIVALANKEALVCAGHLFMAEARAAGATILPVDSEHNAIFQVFDDQRRAGIDKIILTASGGPFRTLSRQEMSGKTPEEAAAHPNWSMGLKISIDSASMFNKGLEMIEAAHLFGMTEDRIQVLVHPQSVVHSLVSYIDGSVLAQLGVPDMRTPIAHALAWPERMSAPTERLDLSTWGQLTFEAPDEDRFPALRLARAALAAGEAAPPVLNAANEVAVAAFVERRIGFCDIPSVVETTIDRLAGERVPSLEDVFAIDGVARRFATEAVSAVS